MTTSDDAASLTSSPGLDDWRALARSGPWRWDRVTAVVRDHSTGALEKWRLDPVRLRLTRGAESAQAESLDGTVLQAAEDPGIDRWANRNAGQSVLVSSGDPEQMAAVQALIEQEERDRLHGLHSPDRRGDGLIAERERWAAPDPPYWQNYFVTALLDPHELADGTERTDEPPVEGVERPSGVRLLSPVAVHERDGRLTWTAELLPTDAYEPRCGCCALVSTCQVMCEECGVDGAKELGWTGPEVGPEKAVVSLDVETSIVTELRVIGGPEDGRHVTIDIESVR